jgi:2-hydroxychromene-2-carboxylate isomerase
VTADECLWYFAYGSNMSPAIFTGRRGMRPDATRWGWLAGYRLVFDLPIGPGERACANVVADGGARMAGVLHRLTPAEAERLDRTEGVPAGVYRRIAVEVETEEAERVRAFTYQSALTTTGRRPSARYLGLLLDGARHHGLPADYVAWLEGFDLAFDERRVPEPLERRTVRCYLAYDSPGAYVASLRLERDVRPLGVAIEYHPVCAPPAHTADDLARLAAACGRTPRPGPCADSRRAALGFQFACADGRGQAYHAGIFAAHFLDGDDVGRDDVLAAVAARAGLDPRRLLAALDDPHSIAALAAATETARAMGGSALPAFVFRDRAFSGPDGVERLVGCVRDAVVAPSLPA